MSCCLTSENNINDRLSHCDRREVTTEWWKSNFHGNFHLIQDISLFVCMLRRLYQTKLKLKCDSINNERFVENPTRFHFCLFSQIEKHFLFILLPTDVMQ